MAELVPRGQADTIAGQQIGGLTAGVRQRGAVYLSIQNKEKCEVHYEKSEQCIGEFI